MKVAAVFLDRDGVINEDRGYTYRQEDLKFLPGVVTALRTFRNRGFKLLVITNQSGVARGFYTLADVHAFHDHMQTQLRSQKAQVDDFFVCPHHPDGSVPEFAHACKCRKPGTLLVEEAIARYDIDRGHSYFVGDKSSDVECALAAGLHAVQVVSPESTPHPGAKVNVQSLAEACTWILSQSDD